MAGSNRRSSGAEAPAVGPAARLGARMPTAAGAAAYPTAAHGSGLRVGRLRAVAPHAADAPGRCPSRAVPRGGLRPVSATP
eukprot:10907925-Lingulodinium_polyedra.AAC.1